MFSPSPSMPSEEIAAGPAMHHASADRGGRHAGARRPQASSAAWRRLLPAAFSFNTHTKHRPKTEPTTSKSTRLSNEPEGSWHHAFTTRYGVNRLAMQYVGARRFAADPTSGGFLHRLLCCCINLPRHFARSLGFIAFKRPAMYL
jgi:hypothetical protein